MIMNQYYFQFNNKLSEQEEGMPMHSPTSNTLSENFLQHVESKHFHKIIAKRKIRVLTRYVDDILLIYASITTNESHIVNDLNSINKKNKIHS